MDDRHLVFVYGTLKRGGSNQGYMRGQKFCGIARTEIGFCLIDLGEYPGMIADPSDIDGVVGEVWAISGAGLARLDALEGVADGLYRRERVALGPPFQREPIDTYFYALPITGHAKIPGGLWIE